MPLIARWPGKIPAATEDDSLVALTDTIATFAEFFGKDLPENSAEDSFSFYGPLFGGEQKSPARESLVMDSYREMMAIRKGPWKLIFGQTGGGARYRTDIDPNKPEGQLFNLESEEREWVNLYRKEPEKVAELTSLYEKIRDSGRSR